MKKHKILLFLVPLLVLGGLFFFLKPKKLDSATLTAAKATLSSSRLSYKSSIATQTAGDTTITIDTDSADNNTNHLFPADTICFVDPGENGCIGDRTYTVGTIIDTTNFTITDALDDALVDGDFVIASGSSNLTIDFTTVGEIPSGGSVYITIPAINSAGKTNDGIPDTNSTIATNGFDISSLAVGDVSMNVVCTFNATETIEAGDGSNDHRITATTTAACAGGSNLIMTINNTKLINPAPYGTHVQGTADVYTVNAKTRDDAGTPNTIDEIDIKVAPVEAVLVSATVEETLSFQFEGLATGSSACGKAMSVTSCNDGSCSSTVSTIIPWGTLTATDTFYYAAQELTVSTNADGGYGVTIEEDDQLNKDFLASPADVCDLPGNGTADETDNCIKDTTCDSSCSESSEDDWETTSNNGFGFSLDNIAGGGTDAAFEYNVVTGGCLGTAESDFCTRQIADMQASETKANIMSNTAPVSGSNVYVCFGINISATQPSGYYINKVKYIVTAIF